MNVTFFKDMLQSIGDRARTLSTMGGSGGGDVVALATRLLACRGDASRVAIARQLIESLDVQDEAGMTRFLKALATDFGPDTVRLQKAIDAYRQSSSHSSQVELHEAAEPLRQELIRRINLAPQGTAAVVRLRGQLLSRLSRMPDLAPLDHDFTHLLRSWFNRGFLVLRPIDWHTPAAVLEKIIHYEAVHEISGWGDLRRRIALPDRRCYAFFHPALNDEPLIFVEVALTREVPAAIAPILASDRSVDTAEAATTAVFYGISNCQSSLRGITFGNFIIKQVVEDLARELPGLRRFVTLSPVPDLCRWIESQSGQAAAVREQRLTSAFAVPDWQRDPLRSESLRQDLMPVAAHYLLNAKSAGGVPIDPVARFHLGNGARLERINWMADTSSRGLRQGAGIMVNYRYARRHIESNHETLANAGQVVAAKAVFDLAAQYPTVTTR